MLKMNLDTALLIVSGIPGHLLRDEGFIETREASIRSPLGGVGPSGFKPDLAGYPALVLEKQRQDLLSLEERRSSDSDLLS